MAHDATVRVWNRKSLSMTTIRLNDPDVSPEMMCTARAVHDTQTFIDWMRGTHCAKSATTP